jgi:hypothetical protein
MKKKLTFYALCSSDYKMLPMQPYHHTMLAKGKESPINTSFGISRQEFAEIIGLQTSRSKRPSLLEEFCRCRAKTCRAMVVQFPISSFPASLRCRPSMPLSSYGSACGPATTHHGKFHLSKKNEDRHNSALLMSLSKRNTADRSTNTYYLSINKSIHGSGSSGEGGL